MTHLHIPKQLLAVAVVLFCTLTQCVATPKQKSLNDDFLAAAHWGETSRVKSLLAQGASINAKDGGGCNALMLAASQGHKDILQILLDRGVDINSKDKQGFTALMWVNMPFAHIFDSFKFLLARGANVNVRDHRGWTALMWAVKRERTPMARALLAHGAKVNIKNNDGETALTIAMQEGNKPCSALLRKAGAKGIGEPTLHPSKAWKIAFVRHGGIWAANGDGSGQKLIIKHAQSPCWSPDKKRIAFARNGNIWVANADGSGQRQLTFRWRPIGRPDEPATGGRHIGISWNPVEKMITFSNEEEYRVRLSEDKEEQIAYGNAIFGVPASAAAKSKKDEIRHYLGPLTDHSYPAWSKSGKRLAFVREGDIWIAERGDKRNPQALREGDLWNGWEWDITRLAAVAVHDNPTYRCSRENEWVTHLSWAPDEKYLAYGMQRIGGSGFREVHLLRLDLEDYGSSRAKEDRMLSDNGSDPCFSPDGKFIAYYGEGAGDFYGILVVSIKDKIKRRLIEGEACQPAW